MGQFFIKIMILVVLVILLAGCGSVTPTATPVPPTNAPPTATLQPSSIYFEPSAQTFAAVPTYQIGLADLNGDEDGS